MKPSVRKLFYKVTLFLVTAVLPTEENALDVQGQEKTWFHRKTVAIRNNNCFPPGKIVLGFLMCIQEFKCNFRRNSPVFCWFPVWHRSTASILGTATSKCGCSRKLRECYNVYLSCVKSADVQIFSLKASYFFPLGYTGYHKPQNFLSGFAIVNVTERKLQLVDLVFSSLILM